MPGGRGSLRLSGTERNFARDKETVFVGLVREREKVERVNEGKEGGGSFS
jgi:P pilus assembly chaperone PapD